MLKKIYLITLTIGIAGCTKKKPQPETKEVAQENCAAGSQKSCVRLGVIEQSERKYNEARNRFSIACEKMGDGAEGCARLGELDYHEDVDASNKLMLKACDSGPDGAWGCYAYGYHKTAWGNFDQAKEYLLKACSADIAEGCFEMAQIVRKSGDNDMAKKYFKASCDSGLKEGCETLADMNDTSYKSCSCNFNGCLKRKERSCARVIECKNTSEDVYVDQVHNKRRIALSARKFCYDPFEGIMRGD